MTNRLPDESKANPGELEQLDAEIEAAIWAVLGKHYEPRIGRIRQEVERKQQELEALESEYSQAVERYLERLRGEAPRNGSLRPSTPEQGDVGHSRESDAAQNSSPGLPTRRKMLLSVLPEFEGGWFKRRDADAKILERWPEAEPKSRTERKTFAAANAGFLNDLAKEGRLEARKGEGKFDPAEYRVIDNDEDTLLKSGP